MTLYQGMEEIKFVPDVYAFAQSYASMNSTFLKGWHIGTVSEISANAETNVVSVSMAVYLPSLILGILRFERSIGSRV